MSLELLGAFLSGVGSILGAGIAIRRTVRRCDRECEERMRAFREGLHEGRET
jgi:hypothetical protein